MDSDYIVIALLRSHQFEADVTVKVNEVYPIAYTTNINSDQTIHVLPADEFLDWANRKLVESEQQHPVPVESPEEAGPVDKKDRKRRRRHLTVKQLLLGQDSGLAVCGPDIIEHCVLSAGLSPSQRLDQLLQQPAAVRALCEQLQQAPGLVSQLDLPGQPGFILAQASSSEPPEPLQYMEFSPLLLLQHGAARVLRMDSFEAAVDEFFARSESQRLARASKAAQETAARRVEKVRADQLRALARLEEQQRALQRGAGLLEQRAAEVEQVALVLNSALDSGMGWRDLEQMVASERARGNPFAGLVHSLQLRQDQRCVTLALSADPEDEPALVPLDLGLSAHANARSLYQQAKAAQAKELKTRAACERALQAVEQQAQRTLDRQQLRSALSQSRTPLWFEKFLWFLSSEGFLVLAARDLPQGQLLVRRFLRPADVYVHADQPGAPVCVVRARRGVVSPLAVQEAGALVVCRSSAWAGKLLCSAWWAAAGQVSAQDCPNPPGLEEEEEVHYSSSFLIRGPRHFLPPAPLELGLAVWFGLDPASADRHRALAASRERCHAPLEQLGRAMQRYGLSS
eukprot:CAMPEP_0170070728 /NCGR_PEP_ID=MMETSP0019_2-20121128/8909_1 /TAXON_ID=98059 /ORGANISM="Dinobryon sp., Strain UTEXLB2267" /LENGTH=571 /DNA_ID=CAMNT_0010279075 /DNA_START=348 /DNA_END=2060 /DNA_ORIENTATION=+